MKLNPLQKLAYYLNRDKRDAVSPVTQGVEEVNRDMEKLQVIKNPLSVQNPISTNVFTKLTVISKILENADVLKNLKTIEMQKAAMMEGLKKQLKGLASIIDDKTAKDVIGG